MPHLNSILADTARDFLSTVTARTRYRYVYDPVTLEPSVEDSGKPYDLPFHTHIKHLLGDAAGPEHGIQSLRDVLKSVLLGVAAKHTPSPAKAVELFLAQLERRDLQSFIVGGDDRDRVRRDTRLRRKVHRLGYRLVKSRKRDPFSDHYQVYDLVDRDGFINLDAPRDLNRLERWVENQRTDGDQRADKPCEDAKTAIE